MAKRLKTGIVALGLGILLGLNTPVFAKDTEEPKETVTQTEQEPSLAHPMTTEYLTYETKTLENDDKTIKLKIDYQIIILLANEPLAGQDTIILTGKKQKQGGIKLEELWHYSEQPTKMYKKNEINSYVKILAEKILTEKIKNSETDLIYDLFDAFKTETKPI